MRRRQKASDTFREANFVFGQKVGFEQAFPQIEDAVVEVREIGEGVWGEGKAAYAKEHIGEFIDCSNPICFNGGFSIGKILREMVRNRQTELKTGMRCRGYEGSPKGRRKYRDCFNYFEVTASVKYKEEPDEESSPDSSQ